MPQNMPLQERISQDSTASATYRVNVSELGNGFRQYASDGINVKREKWNIVYNNVDETELATLVAAFDAVGGSGDYFNWTAHGEAVSKKWTITPDGYSFTNNNGNRTVTLTIEREYR